MVRGSWFERIAIHYPRFTKHDTRYTNCPLPAGNVPFGCCQTIVYFNIILNIVNKKTAKKYFFLRPEVYRMDLLVVLAALSPYLAGVIRNCHIEPNPLINPLYYFLLFLLLFIHNSSFLRFFYKKFHFISI